MRISSASPSSRRRFVRRAVTLPVELISSRDDAPVLQWAADLTPFGLWIDTRFPLPHGEHVVVALEPPGWELGEMTLFARVTRSQRVRDGERPGMGLSFLDIGAAERVALGGWLRGRPPPLPVSVRRAA
jgi:hypothetical protein